MCGPGRISKEKEKKKSEFIERHEDQLQDDLSLDSFVIIDRYEADDEAELPYEQSPVDFSVEEGLTSRKKKAQEQIGNADKLKSELQSGAVKKEQKSDGDAGSDMVSGQRETVQRDYHVTLPGNPENDYESQSGKPNNCFACTASAMMNQHFRKMQNWDGVKVNQDDVRAYIPKPRSLEDYLDQYKGNDSQSYENALDHIKEYVGIDKTQMGNIFAIADFFMQFDPTVSVNCMQMNLGDITDEQYLLMKNQVLDTIKDAVTSGEAVGLLDNTKKHYTTIIGINGNMIRYLDSNDGDPNEIHEEPIDTILLRGNNDYEFTWLSNDTRSDEKLADDYGDFYISEAEGKLKSNSQIPVNDVAHSCGISATLSEDEKKRDGIDEKIAGKITRTIYIPRQEKINQVPHLKLNEHRSAYHKEQGIPEVEDHDVPDLEVEEEEEKRKPLKVGKSEKKQEDKKEGGREEDKREEDKEVEEKKEDKKEKDKEDKEQESDKKAKKDQKEEDPLGQLSLKFGMIDKIEQIRNLAYVFTGTADKDRSESFLQLKDALVKQSAMLDAISKGKFTLTGAEYPQFLELYMALDRYIIEHRGAILPSGTERLNAAVVMKSQIDQLTSRALDVAGINTQEKLVHYSAPDLNFAKANVDRFIDAYFEYSKRIGMDLISSDEDKLVKKWNAIKSCERDILICFQLKNEAQMSDKEKLILKEYRSLRTQMALRNATKKKTQKEDFGDEGLSQQQIMAISRIDTWVIRNIRNGGMFRAISDRTDIAGRLMSMTKRQRLYAYYLVEKKERVTPSLNGVSLSQIDYIPDVKEFKNQMIASKAKFYMRFSGSYIYWDKLTKAMGISYRATPILEEAREYLGIDRDKKKLIEKDKKKLIAAQGEGPALKPEDHQKQRIRDMLENAQKAMELLNKNEKLKKAKKPNQSAIDKNNQELVSLANEAHAIMADLAKIQQELLEIKAKKGEKMSAADYREGFANPAGDFSKVISSVNHESWKKLVTGDPKLTDIFGLSSAPPTTFTHIYTDGANGLAAIGGIVGIVLGLSKLYNETFTMSRMEFVTQTASVSSSIMAVGKSATEIVKVSTSAGTVHTLAQMATSPVAALGFACVDTTVAVLKGASNARDSYYRHSAAKFASKEKEKGKRNDERYRDGMLRLNEKLANRQLTSTMSSVITAGVSVTASALILASVVTGGITAVGALIALGVGIGARVLDRKYSRQMKFAIFDSYYGIDDIVKEEKKKYRTRFPGRNLSKEQEERILDQVRGKVAAENGYYSPGHAARAVSQFYADYLIKGSKEKGDHGKMCIAMIKGLGLHYEHDEKNPANDVPTISDIVKKLCS